MRVSIVISTYNRAEKLNRALGSVLDQTFKNWDCIVVDDASTDNTKEVVQSFKDHRIVYVPRDENFGTDTKPKNQGILLSTGEYIAFLDDDNEYLPDHLMVLTQEARRHPEVDVIYGDRLIIDDEKQMDPQIGVRSDPNPAILFQQNYIDTSDVLVKRSAIYAVGGFDERYRKYVDWNLWVRMTKACMTFHRVAKVITNYHLHKDMKSLKVKDSGVGTRPFGPIMPEQVFKPAWDPFELEIVLPHLGTLQEPRVAVFTLTKDRLEYTKVMYESLKKAGYPFTWYVVDQGSSDGTVEWIKGIKSTQKLTIKPTFNKENRGISGGSNQALDLIGDKYDFIIKIDNDAEILTDQWLSKLLSIYQAHWQIVLSPYVEGLIDNPGGMPRMGYKSLRGHMVGITGHIGGIFTIAHKSAYKGFRWDEEDFLHGMQDTIFSQEMQKRGYLVGYVEDMRVAHIDTTQGQKEKFPDYFKQRLYEKTHTAKI